MLLRRGRAKQDQIQRLDVILNEAHKVFVQTQQVIVGRKVWMCDERQEAHGQLVVQPTYAGSRGGSRAEEERFQARGAQKDNYDMETRDKEERAPRENLPKSKPNGSALFIILAGQTRVHVGHLGERNDLIREEGLDRLFDARHESVKRTKRAREECAQNWGDSN